MNEAQCPICKAEARLQGEDYGRKLVVRCPRCGLFEIGTIASLHLNGFSDRQRANLSGWLRDNAQGPVEGRPQFTVLTGEKLEGLKDLRTPTVGEQAEKLLLQLEPLMRYRGAFYGIIEWSENTYQDLIGAAWALNKEELLFLLDDFLCKERKLISLHQSSEDVDTKIRITPAGYSFLDDLRRTRVDSQIGFCAMWFHPKLNSVWEEAIEPAIREAGYEPKIIRKHQHNNRIDDEIIAMIRRSKFVVADYTGNRGGVYFEAGYAKGLGLEVIWTCRKNRQARLHFDVDHYNFIFWDLDRLTEFKNDLKNRILATPLLGPGNKANS